MEKNQYKILIVDDEKDILEFLSYNLIKENFEVHTSTNGSDAIKIAKKIIPNLILLDVMMPRMDGIETCEDIRKIPELDNSLVAFLTARGEDYSQIAGFEAGGDDYITKPIKPKVLISRINALLKRTNNISPSIKIIKNLEEKTKIKIDKDRFTVVKDKKELILPKKEFELLSLLISKPGKVFTRKEIFNTVWGENTIVGDRTIDVHIRKLREKLGEKYIHTIKGVGYKFGFDI